MWKLLPKFENWLQIFDYDDSKVRCTVCDSVMSAKKSVLQKHARSKKHIEAVNAEYCRNVGDGDTNNTR